MAKIYMENYYVIGERAEEAAEYIDAEESAMIHRGAANDYFAEDYLPNLKAIKAKAAELFGVTYENIFD